jgi:hypothetical protein
MYLGSRLLDPVVGEDVHNRQEIDVSKVRHKQFIMQCTGMFIPDPIFSISGPGSA